MDETTGRKIISLLEKNFELLEKINVRQESMFRLQAMTALAEKPQREQIERLRDFGFQPRDIAQILGTSSNAVRVAMARMKKSRKN